MAPQLQRPDWFGDRLCLQVANAFVNLHAIRHHLNSTLPITLGYWGAHPPDALNPEVEDFFQVWGFCIVSGC